MRSYYYVTGIMFINYLDKDAKLKTIEGVVCSITHTITEDWTKTTYIKIY